MNILIVILPFLSFLMTILFGRFIGSRGTSIITISMMAISLILSLINLYYTVKGEYYCIIFEYFPWIEDGSFSILSWSFLFDPLTNIMLVIVLFISTLVHIYSVGYMYYDPHLVRFMSYLSLFTFFMIMLVTSGNLIQIFLGWEGVGLASYLLINFWYTRLQANKSAIKAVIINKFGDFALLIAIIFTYDYYKSLDFGVIFPLIYIVTDDIFAHFLTTRAAFKVGLWWHLGISNWIIIREDEQLVWSINYGETLYKPEFYHLAFIHASKILRNFLMSHYFIDYFSSLVAKLFFFFDWLYIWELFFRFFYTIYSYITFHHFIIVKKITIISYALVIAAIGKSAQLGLHTWLPDAMEGPTPVSALIHAATMVTAGIFLLTRCSWYFNMAGDALIFLQFMGAITAFFAGVVGVAQNDLKKVIAYSTCSQLGYMAFTCGLGDFSIAMFHLSNHAFFKALLFLCAGSVIHGLNNEQDMRRMGGLNVTLPLTYTLLLIGSLALMGFPFLTGFYSKDVILEWASIFYRPTDFFTHMLGIAAAFFTAYYSIRLLYLTFLTTPKGSKKLYYSSHESDIFITGPLLILGIFSIFIGYLTSDLFIGWNTTFWDLSWCEKPLYRIKFLNHEFALHYNKLLPLIFTICGSLLSLIIYRYKGFVRIRFSKLSRGFFGFNIWNLHNFINKKWYFDAVYNTYFAKPYFKFGYNWGFKVIDQGLIQFFGPKGLINLFTTLSSRVSYMHSGYIYHLFLVIFVGLFLLLIALVSPIFYQDSYLNFFVIKWMFFDSFVYIIKYINMTFFTIWWNFSILFVTIDHYLIYEIGNFYYRVNHLDDAIAKLAFFDKTNSTYIEFVLYDFYEVTKLLLLNKLGYPTFLNALRLLFKVINLYFPLIFFMILVSPIIYYKEYKSFFIKLDELFDALVVYLNKPSKWFN